MDKNHTREFVPRYARTRWSRHASGQEEHARLRGPALQLAWGAFLGRVRWDNFVTLTFDPKRVFPVGQERAVREAVSWCNGVARALRTPVGWVVAPERTRSGQWHSHALLVGVEHEQAVALAAPWQFRNGMIDIRRVAAGDSNTIALYTTKEAAITGEAVLSDTLGRYMLAAAEGSVFDNDAFPKRADQLVVELHHRSDRALRL
jgi:hypothetical protein